MTLIDRLTGGEGPDADLDYDINVHFYKFDPPQRKEIDFVVAKYTSSIDACVELAENFMPDWWFSIGHCSLSGDASFGPDHRMLEKNHPFNKKFDGGFHLDLREGTGISRMCRSFLSVLIEAHEASKPRELSRKK